MDELEKDFAWARLTTKGEPLHADQPAVFLVQVKSDTDIGRRMLNEPLAVLREEIPEMGLEDETDVRAMILRVNAEIPANPRHRAEVWAVFPGSTTAVAIQYKYQ